MEKSTNRICKQCGISHSRLSQFKKGYCSEACHRMPRLDGNCLPCCNEANITVQSIIFKDGTKHAKRVCPACRKGHGYLSIKTDARRKSLRQKIQVKAEKFKRLYGENFYTSEKWLRLRYLVFSRDERSCAICNAEKAVFHIDHIKPRHEFPELEYDINNLRILCASCNLGKSNLNIGGA